MRDARWGTPRGGDLKPWRKFHVRGVVVALQRRVGVRFFPPSESHRSWPVGSRGATPAAELSRQMDTLDKRFLKAAQAGDLIEAKRLLVESPAVVHARSTSKGYTALHFAAMGGAIPVVEWLLEQGFDVEEPSRATATAPGGVTPLAVALEYKRFTTVRRLQQLRNGEARPHVDLAVLAAAGPTRHGSRPLLAAPQLATARHSGLLGWSALALPALCARVEPPSQSARSGRLCSGANAAPRCAFLRAGVAFP